MGFFDKLFQDHHETEEKDEIHNENSEQLEFVKFLMTTTSPDKIQHHIVYDHSDKNLVDFMSNYQINSMDPRFSQKDSSDICYGDSVLLVIHMIIGKKQINAKNIASVSSIIDQIVENIQTRQRICCLIGIFIHGYDSDQRLLWDIPEVKWWYNSLNEKYPYLLFILHPVDIPIFMAMHGSVKNKSLLSSTDVINGLNLSLKFLNSEKSGKEFCTKITGGNDITANIMIQEATTRLQYWKENIK